LQVGTPAWLEQHEAVEALNLQAHLNAQAHADEFVKEALVSLDKLGVLVHELLVAEVGTGWAGHRVGWALGGLGTGWLGTTRTNNPLSATWVPPAMPLPGSAT